MENLHLKLEQFEGETIVIREGDALEIKPPEKIKISGDINTVKSFIDKRKKIDAAMDAFELAGRQGINPDRTVVTVDKSNLSITLELDPEDFYGTVVTGKLEIEPELTKFSIETTKKFTQQELIKLLRYGKRWFADPAAHETLLLAYMKLDVKVTADLTNNAPDSRGNRSNSFEKKVTSNIPEDFILNIPIFKGQEPKRFRVEIAMDSTDESVKFWLESVELAELIQIEAEKILNEQLKSCEDYVVIWK
jgi:hypothetical protein